MKKCIINWILLKQDYLKSNLILKYLLFLAGGTVFAQLITIISLPILTRIYSPEAFDLLAIFSSLILLFSVSSCLRFDIAIPIADNDHEAFDLLVISLFVNTAINIFIFIIVFLYLEKISLLLNKPSVSPYLVFIPIGSWLIATVNCLQSWFSRKKKFKELGKIKVYQALNSSIFQIVYGFFFPFGIGLVAGLLINYLSGIFGLFREFFREFKGYNLNFYNLKIAFSKYSMYPKYSALESLISSASNQLPIVLISIYSLSPEAAYLLLACKLMLLPIGLIGTSISQVYLSYAPEEMRKNNLVDFTKKILIKVFKVLALPLIVIAVFAPLYIPIVFGEEWRRTGEMILFLAPGFFLQTLVFPVSMVLNIMNKQKVFLFLQIFGFVVRVLGLVYSFNFFKFDSFIYFAISNFIFYLVFLIVILNELRKYKMDFRMNF